MGHNLTAVHFVVNGSIQTYPGMIFRTSQVTLDNKARGEVTRKSTGPKVSQQWSCPLLDLKQKVAHCRGEWVEDRGSCLCVLALQLQTVDSQ